MPAERHIRRHRSQARTGEYVEGLLESADAEVEHVVIGVRAGVEPGSGQAGDIAWVHPVQRGLEVVIAGDAGLEVDDPEIRRQLAQDLHRIAHGHEKSTGWGMGPEAASASVT